MKTNHTNRPQGGQVFCFRIDRVIDLDENFFKSECEHCPYFNGTDQGRGVECLFDDACGEPEQLFYMPAESERHSKSMYVRLGMKTQEEVDGNLETQQPIEISKTTAEKKNE